MSLHCKYGFMQVYVDYNFEGQGQVQRRRKSIVELIRKEWELRLLSY